MELAVRRTKETGYKTLRLEEVIDRISNPSKEDLGVILSIRNLKKTDAGYRYAKEELPMVHFGCTFDGQSTAKKNVVSSTGYLFFDIDGEEEDVLKNNKYVYTYWKSCGGKGWGGLIRVKNYPTDPTSALYQNIMTLVGVVEYTD